MVTTRRPSGQVTVVPSVRVVVQLDRAVGPCGAHRVEAPARIMRIWAVLNAANEELHQVTLPPEALPRLQSLLEAVKTELERSVSPALADELRHLTASDHSPKGAAELRVECVSLLGWASGLVLGMLDRLEDARLRQREEERALAEALRIRTSGRQLSPVARVTEMPKVPRLGYGCPYRAHLDPGDG